MLASKVAKTPNRRFSAPPESYRGQLSKRQSFNNRLGVHGPTEDLSSPTSTDSPKFQKSRDITPKSSSLSTSRYIPDTLSRKSFNNRLEKVRTLDQPNSEENGSDIENSYSESSDECHKLAVDLNGTVDQGVDLKDTADQGVDLNGTADQAVDESLDEVLAKYIKEDLEPQLQDINENLTKSFVTLKLASSPLARKIGTMSESSVPSDKRDLAGNSFIMEDTLGVNVIKGKGAMDEGNSDRVVQITQPKASDGKFVSRRSENFQPKRKESPIQHGFEKISRYDFPTSFGGNKRRVHYDCDVVDEVEKYFNKKFYLSRKNQWVLPDSSQLFTAEPWELKELLECKNKLNAVKEKLNDLNLSSWHAHTKSRNRAGLILWKLRKIINPEFPTQAWCKFYENMSTFKLVPPKAIQDKCLNSVHLCEAPGAFITSLNHFIKTNFQDDFKWNWVGTTLNPHYEGNPLSLMINEDRFILHTMDHWTFGGDQTGDLMTPPNISDLMDRAEKLGDVLLVTADGSIDCQDDPGEQENYVAWLHFCEAVSAMLILSSGGNFILKIFTVFEHMTISLLYLLSCMFEEVIINKPATSKEGNSETYAVCKNFAGKDKLDPYLSVIINNYGPNRPKKALLPKEAIPEDFLKAVIECADKFREYQTEIIENNLKSFRTKSEGEAAKNEQIRRAVADEFFHRYKIKELPEKYDIVGRRIINQMEAYNLDPRMEMGSFSDKKKRSEVPELQKILDLKEDVEILEQRALDKWPSDKDIWWYKFHADINSKLSEDVKIITGKPVKRINSSKFCLGRLLDIRNKVRDIVLNANKFQVDTPESPERELITIPNGSRVLDFKNTLWASSDSGHNAEEEYAAFTKIIEVFDRLNRDDNLVIFGYPLLTQFNVGLIYLLAHSFERVGLTRPVGENFAVIFEKHDVSNMKFKVKEKLDEISEKHVPNKLSVLAMLPIQKLCKGEFYRYVTMANNLCVKEQVLELIRVYLEMTETKEERAKRRWTTA